MYFLLCRMEIFCRDLTEKYPNVYVISGPVMKAGKEDNGKKFIRHYVSCTDVVFIIRHYVSGTDICFHVLKSYPS